MSDSDWISSPSEGSEKVDFSDFDIEDEDDEEIDNSDEGHTAISIPYPYSEESISCETWLEEYKQRKEETLALEKELNNRLNGATSLSEWCKCERCDIAKLQNISECYCCNKLDGCKESLESDLVVQDLSGVIPKCVTEHPGFNSVCLQKWSLRLASDKYKKRNKETYKQTGSEERFLRSVAYIEFTRMVYGFLGKKRYPLPACAYTAIRKAFESQDEECAGFEMDDTT